MIMTFPKNMLESFRNKSVLLVGFEKTNRAFYERLKTVEGVQIGIADKNAAAKLPSGVAAHLGDDYLANMQDYDVIVRSPGVRYWPELLAMQERVTTATQLFFEHVRASSKARVVGVTGTKGKSTTSTLVHLMLKDAGFHSLLVGNIGAQDWDRADRITDDSIIVYEMSSYMLCDFTERPDIAVMLNAHTSHIDWHGTFEAYVNAKGQITAFQTPEDTLIFNATDPALTQIANRTLARAVPFKHMQTMHHDGDWFYDGSRELFETREVRVPGRHNRDNVLAVLAVAKTLGVDVEHVHHIVKTFVGLPHRLEFVGTFRKIDFYDDAIASNPDSTMAALHTFAGRIGSLILGGKDSGVDFWALAHLIAYLKIPVIVSMPGARHTINGTLEHAGYAGKIVEVDSMREAVDACFRETAPETIALLSTATQSYDLFKNFEEQGDAFQRFVREIGNKKNRRL